MKTKQTKTQKKTTTNNTNHHYPISKIMTKTSSFVSSDEDDDDDELLNYVAFQKSKKKKVYDVDAILTQSKSKPKSIVNDRAKTLTQFTTEDIKASSNSGGCAVSAMVDEKVKGGEGAGGGLSSGLNLDGNELDSAQLIEKKGELC